MSSPATSSSSEDGARRGRQQAADELRLSDLARAGFVDLTAARADIEELAERLGTPQALVLHAFDRPVGAPDESLHALCRLAERDASGGRGPVRRSGRGQAVGPRARRLDGHRGLPDPLPGGASRAARADVVPADAGVARRDAAGRRRRGGRRRSAHGGRRAPRTPDRVPARAHATRRLGPGAAVGRRGLRARRGVPLRPRGRRARCRPRGLPGRGVRLRRRGAGQGGATRRDRDGQGGRARAELRQRRRRDLRHRPDRQRLRLRPGADRHPARDRADARDRRHRRRAAAVAGRREPAAGGAQRRARPHPRLARRVLRAVGVGLGVPGSVEGLAARGGPRARLPVRRGAAAPRLAGVRPRGVRAGRAADAAAGSRSTSPPVTSTGS